MQTVQMTVEVPKEMNDVRVALTELVKDILAKKDLATIAAENLPNVYAAIDGASQISEEAKSAAAVDLGALLAADVTKILMGKA